jgi:HAD superfamily hydrolase (TIGR01549 family)
MNTVIFDVDGTLVDTNYQHALAWYTALVRQDVTVPIWRIHRAIGMGGDRLVAHVAGDEVEDRLGDTLRAEWKKIYQRMIDEVRAFDGARSLVEAAADRGWRVALASSGDPAHVKHYLDLLDLHDLVDDWTSAEDVSQTKPAPDLLKVALDRAGNGPAVLIGDSTWDCVAAHRAGMPCATLLTGGFGRGELLDAGAAAVYEDLTSLRRSLDVLPFSSPA